MKKKKQINKKQPLKPLDKDVLNKLRASLLCAVTQSLGYNPNINYVLTKKTKHKDLPDIPTNLLTLQNKVIFVSNMVKNELLSCKKYIYKIDVKNVTHKNRKKGDHQQIIYHMVGKTSLGYVPFTLIIVLKENSIKSSLSAILHGSDHFYLTRHDNQSINHYNHVLHAKTLQFEPIPHNRLVSRAHKHEYDENVMLYIYNNLIKLHKSTQNLLLHKVLKECDAKTLQEPLNNFQKMMEVCVGQTNISCMLGFKEDDYLNNIYDYCFNKEQSLLSMKGLNNLDAFGKNKLKNIYTKNNLNNIDPDCYSVMEN